MRKYLACVVLAVTVGLPATAAADPVRVTSGQFNIDHEGDWYVYSGEGFDIRLSRADTLVNYGLWVDKIWGDTCFIPMTDETCTLGETLDVSFTTPADSYMGIGDVTIGDTTYESVALRGTLDFDFTPILLTSELSEFSNGRSPFAFSGVIRGLTNGTELFSISLFGAGRTHIPLFREGNMVFGEEGKVIYEFEDIAATPEPATLLLLGTGLAATIARRRRSGR